jgi:hypothetical protein
MVLGSPMRERVASSRSLCRSTILSCLPLRSRASQESQLNEYGDVGARRGGGRKKDPKMWLANLDASKAAAFCANCSKKT